MNNKTTTAIHVKIKSDVKLIENDDFNDFLTGVRKKISEAFNLDIESVQVVKVIQEEPLWTNPDIDSAVAEA